MQLSQTPTVQGAITGLGATVIQGLLILFRHSLKLECIKPCAFRSFY